VEALIDTTYSEATSNEDLKNMRIAAIGLCDPGYSEEFVRRHHLAAVAEIARAGVEVVDAGLQPDEQTSGNAVSSMLRAHAEGPFDALIIIQAAWARPAVLLQVIRAFPHMPTVLYSPGGEIVRGVIRSTASAAGAGASLHILRRHGIPFKYVWSAPGKAIAPESYLPFLRAARAVRCLCGMKLGMVGFGDMRLQSTGFDVQEIHESFGVEVESLDMLELEKGMQSIPSDEVARQAEALTAGWAYEGQRHPEGLRKIIAAYLSLDRLATERGYAGVSIKCPTGVAQTMEMTPCLVGCLLARTRHYVCENDIPGLLTQVILGTISDQPSTYLELYEILDDGLLVGCCGFCPEALLAEPLKVRTYESFFTGMACCSRIKTGPYTVARLGKARDGRFIAQCADGVASDPPAWCEEALGPPQHPSVKFRPGQPLDQFLQGILAQHLAVVPGHWAEAFGEFARLAGIIREE
jgi:L-fucose isomerase-like protein